MPKAPRKDRPSNIKAIVRMMQNRAQELIIGGANEAKVKDRLIRAIGCADAGSNPCMACGTEIPFDTFFGEDPLTEVCSEACVPRAKELAAFRESLHARIDELSAENRKLQKNIRRASIDQGRAKEDSGTHLAIDDTTAAQADKIGAEIDLCKDIIDHINKGAYGICEDCEENIPAERLKVRPLAKHCVKCLTEKEQEEKKKRKR